MGNKKDLTEEIFLCTHCAVGQANDLSKLLFELAVQFIGFKLQHDNNILRRVCQDGKD